MMSIPGTIYLGFKDQKISMGRIKMAKEKAGMPPSAILVGVSYLGFMTDEEMKSLV